MHYRQLGFGSCAGGWHCGNDGPFAAFQYELAVAAEGLGEGLLEQGKAALHHRHPVAGHPHHGPVLIQPHQLGLLRQQHPGGGQLESGQHLLPQLGQGALGL